MHEEKHNYHINGVMVVIATLLVGGILWYLIASSGDSYTATPIDVDAGVTSNTEALYRNSDYGFSLRYDKRFTLPTIATDDTARYTSQDVGKKLLVLNIPHDMFPNTNFSEGIISVWGSQETKAVQNCLVAADGETEKPSNNDLFTLFTSTDAGAGNFYEISSYRTIQNGACIVIDKVIHSTNIGNYDEEAHVTEFDRSAVNAILDRVVESFHFN